jgi:ribonuclease HI
MHANGFELSAEKTTLMVFTRSNFIRDEFVINVNNHEIAHSTTAKFLGVILHQNLKWGPHIKHLISKARKGVSIIKLLCGMTWVSPKSLIHLTNALVRSRLVYGNEATFCKRESQWLALERIELRALKAALNVPLYAINDLVYQIAGWLPLRDQCKVLSARFQVRAANTTSNVNEVLSPHYLPEDDIKRKRLAKSRPLIHKDTISIVSYTKELFQGVPSPDVSIPNQTNVKPWSIQHPKIDFQYAERYSKKKNPQLISSLAKEHIDRYYSTHLKCFTDGSIFSSGKAGCAFTIPELNYVKTCKLNDGISTFSAELHAILEACEYFNNLSILPPNIVIISDSKSVLQALNAGGTKNRFPTQKHVLYIINEILSKNINLSLLWVPSHCNIRGNEIADRFAKKASSTGTPTNIDYSLNEIYNKIDRNACKIRHLHMKSRCKAHDWIFLPTLSHNIPNLPRAYLKIINRIRTCSFSFRFKPSFCTCGSTISLHHIFSCKRLHSMSLVRKLQKDFKLTINDFFKVHSSIGIKPMKLFAEAVVSGKLSKLF